jgi:hypothetical protein
MDYKYLLIPSLLLSISLAYCHYSIPKSIPIGYFSESTNINNPISIGYFCDGSKHITDSYLNHHNFINGGIYNDRYYKIQFNYISYDYKLIMKTKHPLNKEFIEFWYHPSRIDKWIDDKDI